MTDKLSLDRFVMRALRMLGACMLFLWTVPGAHADLATPNLIDRVRVDPATGQATLVLVVSFGLDQEGAAQMFERKLGFYRQYVESGRLYRDRSGVSRKAPVVISFNLMAAPNPQTTSYLARAKQVLEEGGYEIRFTQFDPASRKPQRE